MRQLGRTVVSWAGGDRAGFVELIWNRVPHVLQGDWLGTLASSTIVVVFTPVARTSDAFAAMVQMRQEEPADVSECLGRLPQRR